MSELKTQFKYPLKQDFEYAYKGEMRKAEFIIFTAPTSKHMTYCADLKQAFFRALPKDKDEFQEHVGDIEKKELDEVFTSDLVISLLSMSESVELKTVLLTIRELFTKGVGKIDGEEKLTMPLMENILNEEFESMAGEYLVNFIVASSLKKLKKF